MKLVSYRRDGRIRAGVVTDAGVADLQDAAAQLGLEAPSGIVQLLEEGDAGMETARRVAEAATAGEINTTPEADLALLPVLPEPTTIYLLAANYQSHITESGAPPVDKTKITPRPFLKPGSSVIGSGDPIPIPQDSDTLDYEIEIAAVIGTPAKSVSVADAPAHIAGYTVFNDISARSLKISEGRAERNGDWFFDWLLGKWCDGFSVIGPCLVTSDEIADPRDLEMSLKVNGELRQHSKAGEMIFTVPEAIAFLSRFVTLRPGDMICMGTPGGVGDTTATYLKHGDVVEGTIEKLGTITNTVTGPNA
ncbi:MAG TPA: fumarylacetoacetate hydrolase family protein [Thermomicrobiales bacterium]|nr:fumarylacetoacetate hydrolase family protein [Thermomicrobiales bacterium]